MLTALALPVVLVVLGFAVDYSYASYTNQRIARAVDSAVLAAVSQAAATAVGGYTNTTGLQNYGTNLFNANVAGLQNVSLNFQLTVAYNASTNTVTATGRYTGAVPTFFMNVLGVGSIPVAGSAGASENPPVYINYYLVVDNSNSMGIGATQADMTALYNKLNQIGFVQNSETGCVFACHEPSVATLYMYSTEQVARQIGVTLRIDAAVAAIQTILNTATTVAGRTQNLSFGIYLMQDNPNTHLQLSTLQAQTTNYALLSSKAATIDLGSNIGAAPLGDTDFTDGLTALSQIIPANGTGASATSPLNYVFLVTDGVQDQLSAVCALPACVSPINPSTCGALKAKASVGVIYTTYLPIWLNNNPSQGVYELLYGTYVAGIQSQISPNLGQCASSSDLFFQADDGPAITTDMQQLFAKTQPMGARLTQ